MTWSIRCTGHPLSDSKIAAGLVFEDLREATDAAVEQTAHHRSVGLDCTFIPVDVDVLPVLTNIDLEVALENNMTLVEGVDYHYLDENAWS